MKSFRVKEVYTTTVWTYVMAESEAEALDLIDAGEGEPDFETDVDGFELQYAGWDPSSIEEIQMPEELS